MKPSEQLRKAAELLREREYCQGAAARDATGAVCSLYTEDRRINPQVHAVSLYGSIAMAGMQGQQPVHPRQMFDTLHALATEKLAALPAKESNHIHTLFVLADHPAFDKGAAIEFLEAAAAKCETAPIQSERPNPGFPRQNA